ncbi:MAG: Nif3-like dinuclear metal center hexameric protein, partial [Planctomycetota bacterium]|nr:Nif3-like dinuclear metal center hexameric protein [Planctomycetota bacterium]
MMMTSAILALTVLLAAFAAHAADNSPGPGEKTTGADQAKAGAARPTARQLVERIKQNVHCPWSDTTVDTFKAGNPDSEVTGVATTFMASLDVLRRAAASGRNFVITHEPTFYNHLDKTAAMEDDKVLAEK